MRLVHNTIPYMDIIQLRPLRGIYHGVVYRVPRRFLPLPEEVR